MDRLHFRLLEKKDIPLLEQWYEDPELVNRYGGKEWPRRIWKLHQQDEHRSCRIAEVNGTPVGFIDLEMHPEENIAWIGIAVDASKRSKGLGSLMLKEFLQSEIVQSLKEIRAGIEFNNHRSIRCFESAGFHALHPQPDHEGIIDYAFPLRSQS